MQAKLAEALLRRKELAGKVAQLAAIKDKDVFQIRMNRKQVSDSVDDIVMQVPLLAAAQPTQMSSLIPSNAPHAWWVGEDAIRLSILPRVVPTKPNGRKITVRAVYQWVIRGVRGIKLRRFRCGGAWCTTKQEFSRWQVALTEAGR